MRLLWGTVATVIGVWVGAVGARSIAERRVASRATLPVHVVGAPGVIDTGASLWRGPAPSPGGYAGLAGAGVSLVVDLRSEAHVARARDLAQQAGMELLWLPTDNARAPHPTHLERFARTHEASEGITYVHCEAGEGRTGALVGAYAVASGTPIQQALSDACAVGSLTFAQIAYIASGGRAAVSAKILEWGVDRPTEVMFDLARRREP